MYFFFDLYQVLLYLGDFAAARRSLKKAFCLGSQQPSDREAVKRDFKHGEIRTSVSEASHQFDRFCQIRRSKSGLSLKTAQLKAER